MVATDTRRRWADFQIDGKIPLSTAILKAEAMDFAESPQTQGITYVLRCFVLGLEVNSNRVNILRRNPQLLCYLKLKLLQHAYLFCDLLQFQ